MKGVTALKKINARTKQLKKKHPGKKYNTLRKQAAAEYKSGRLPKKRAATKHKPAKKRRKAAVTGKRKYKVTHKVKKLAGPKRKARKRAPAKRKVIVRTRTRTVTKYKRVGAAKSKSMMPLIVGITGLGLLAYFLLKPKSAVPPLVTSNNAVRNQAASNLVAIAQQAGTGLSQLTALINSINKMTDSQVAAAASSVNAGTVPPASIADTYGNYNPYEVSTMDQYS